MSNNYYNNNYYNTDRDDKDPPPPYNQFSPQSSYSSSTASTSMAVPVAPNDNLTREEKFRDIINRHEISLYYSQKLQSLSLFKIVFIFDDSGSMNTSLNDSPLNTSSFKATRWDELQYFSKISIELANIFNENGSDAYFLNRPVVKNIRSISQLMPYFQSRPNGFTPLTRVLKNVLNDNCSHFVQEGKLLIVIITDGEPTDEHGKVDVRDFKRALKDRHRNVYTTIVSATDDDTTMKYLDDWDVTIPRLDVVDDFRSERAQIMRHKGSDYRFTFGDYVVKSMVGSIDSSMDRKDEATNCSVS
jgi:hypothetical protein